MSTIKNVVLVIAVAFITKNILIYLFGESKKEEEIKNQVRVFSADELKKMTNGKELYLSILGSVYDVSKGAKHYAPGGSYSFFSGIDGSRAFVTGNFKDDLNDNVDDLSDSQIADLFNWKKTYDDGYVYQGVLNSRFYNSKGEKTEELLRLEKILEKQKGYEKINAEFNTRFPSCNSEWTQEKGLTKVWCSTESGGIKRPWVGYPRLVYNSNSKSEGCACVDVKDLDHPNVKKYPKCDAKSYICEKF